MVEENSMQDIDLEWEAEKICRWGAARAGVIVVAPLVGTMALMANEVYMIMRLGDLRGVKLEEGAVLGLLASLGATFVGQTLVTLIPFAPVQITVGVSVTYAVGKVANAWIKAGRPEDIAAFRELYEEARKEGMKKAQDFKNMDCKEIPLGDESKKFDLQGFAETLQSNAGGFFQKLKEHADKAENILSGKLADVNEKLQPWKEKSSAWLSAQQWERLSKGELVVPYQELLPYLRKSMVDSEFVVEGLEFAGEDKLRLKVNHRTHGTLEITLKILDFSISNEQASTRLEVIDFAVADNDFAQLVVELMGSKLIMAIVDLIFEQIALDHDKVSSKYEQGIITVEFTELIRNSKIEQRKVLNKSLFSVLHLKGLEATQQGLLVKSAVEL